jgi:GDP-L-fucose synthase
MIFITGGHGYLGSALRGEFDRKRCNYVAPKSSECNLTKAESLRQYDGEAFEQIFHLAAWTQAGDFCLRYPGEQWIINQKINTNILDWWWKSQPQAKLIFMGTSCAYAPGSALVEENYMAGEPVESLYTYAMTKRMLFQGARALGQQFGLRWFCAVPSTLYGPGYHTDDRQMHFIFDLIRKIIRGKEFGEQVILWGDGHQTREVVYMADFVKTLIHFSGSISDQLLNIGSGQELSIREFAKMICEIIDYPPDLIKYDESRYVGARSKCLDVSKMNKLFPSIQMTPLIDGLRPTISWFYESGAYLKTR